MRQSRTRQMEAYGETHDVREWAGILGCSESSVYKHMKSPEIFEDWMYKFIGFTKTWAREYFPNLSVAELVDRNSVRDLGWALVRLLDQWDTTTALLARDEAVEAIDGEFAQVIGWLKDRWRANGGNWSIALLAEDCRRR